MRTPTSVKIRAETLNNEATTAFETIKKLKEQTDLYQLNYKKPIEFTTDASNATIGGVLSQNCKSITFISRTLNKTEHSTNEKELLVIV